MEHESFTLTDHGMQQEGMVVGYHCPDCAQIYTWGRFTLENEKHILCKAETYTCCGKEHPLPLVFETIEDAREFIDFRPKNYEAKFASKQTLVIAHFDLMFFLKNWNRVIQ